MDDYSAGRGRSAGRRGGAGGPVFAGAGRGRAATGYNPYEAALGQYYGAAGLDASTYDYYGYGAAAQQLAQQYQAGDYGAVYGYPAYGDAFAAQTAAAFATGGGFRGGRDGGRGRGRGRGFEGPPKPRRDPNTFDWVEGVVPDMARNCSENADDKCKIFIGGIGNDSDEVSIAQYFQQYGRVSKVDYKGQQRAFAFLVFASPDSTLRVLENQYHTIDGKKVEVKRIDTTVPRFKNQ